VDGQRVRVGDAVGSVEADADLERLAGRQLNGIGRAVDPVGGVGALVGGHAVDLDPDVGVALEVGTEGDVEHPVGGGDGVVGRASNDTSRSPSPSTEAYCPLGPLWGAIVTAPASSSLPVTAAVGTARRRAATTTTTSFRSMLRLLQ
jgi:hypothetical protein